VRFEASFAAVAAEIGAIRRRMVALARECGLDDDRVHEVALAVSEAATNAIVHGYRGAEGTIHVTAYDEHGELTIRIADEGTGLVPRVQSPGLGLGLPIIANLARRVDISSTGQGTEVCMVFPCPGGSAS
jgi:serine/threonine-protein kinase RsbW/stage II sporulation protein AB (anti-sigma F factor)